MQDLNWNETEKLGWLYRCGLDVRQIASPLPPLACSFSLFVSVKVCSEWANTLTQGMASPLLSYIHLASGRLKLIPKHELKSSSKHTCKGMSG